MCGISGIYSYAPSGAPISRTELLATRDAMLARGPDGDGEWVAPDARVGLAHRRLAIIDVGESGAQPMSTPDGRLRVTFNGEIYNFRALRSDLEAHGYAFRSNSDTEVLLALYRQHGPDMVQRLRGMFAFAIWDDATRSLFLARDGFGIKPLYYSHERGVFRFSSQVKAMIAGGAVDLTPDPAGHAGFFLWGAVPEPFTTYRSIRSLPAGCWMRVGPGGPGAPVTYFSVRDELLKAQDEARPMSPEQAQAIVAEALYDTVKHHLVADVPVGLFLSAGIDSSTIASIASEAAGEQLRSVTLGFREYVGTAQDETVLSGKVASIIGARHETRWIDKQDFDLQVKSVLASMDQPSTDGVNTWFVSRAAAQAGLKVAMSGLGGDEIFGGYPSFRDVALLEKLPALGAHAPHLSRAVRRAIAAILGRAVSPKYAGIPEYAGRASGAYLLRRALYMPWELDSLMDADMARAGLEELQTLPSLEASVRGLRTARLRVTALESGWYMRNQLLRDSDWAGMAHSLEIRVPLVDTHFFRAMAPLLAGSNPPGKDSLVRARRKPLPDDIVSRPKTGFSFPVEKWIEAVPKRRAHGLHSWARRINQVPGVGYRLVGLFADAFGGRGGTALYARDFLSAMARHPGWREIVALPRSMPDSPASVPSKISYRTAASAGKVRYLLECMRLLLDHRGVDAIVCGHINLLPIAALMKWWSGAPVLLCTYGIDAWTRPPSLLSVASLRSVDDFLAISEITRSRFLSWAPLKTEGNILPNAIHLDWYSPGGKDEALLERYGLRRRTILMTLGRLAPKERYKGFDQVMDALPGLLAQLPDLAYLIVGDGRDRHRLETKAKTLGLQDVVKFTGYIEEGEKAAHYRLADAYVMPSQGEGFGFVLLEALACGIPVLASKLDGGREAVRNGKLGILVDPANPAEVREGILKTLAQPRGQVPEGLSYFSFPRFVQRSQAILDNLLHRAES